MIAGSDDYKFIHVEEYGYVTSYAPRVSSGDHQHLLFVRGESEIEVPLPVAPQIQQGTITVNIELSTQVSPESFSFLCHYTIKYFYQEFSIYAADYI